MITPRRPEPPPPRPLGNRRWVRSVASSMAAMLLWQGTLCALPAAAQTTPSATAPSGQRAIMDAAQNGVPIAHIAPPSAAGVSRNQYSQFNVHANGLILNNSASPVATQQGGWISGNPQLGPIPARIILNEVVGATPSQLRGTLEVAGQRADIVVANPNGISCDGCGFLNTSRATLTTGQPQFGSEASLQGFSVRAGQLTIGGNGLHAATVEQLDLIARGIVIEGEVWTQNLNLIAGANQVLYGTLEAAAHSGAGPAPRFAIDIKDLGGMVANQVYLVSRELGLGVNSSGRLAALQGNLVLAANGDLTLKDSYARQDIRMASAGNIRLTGQTRSENAVTVVAASRLDNTDGDLTAATAVSLSSASALDNTRGRIISNGDLNLAAASLINPSGTVSAAQATGIRLGSGLLDNTQGLVIGAGTLTVQAGDIRNSAGALAGGTLVLEAHSLNNQAGLIASNGSQTLTLAGELDNRAAGGQAGRIAANGDSAIRAASLNNQGGRIDVLGKASITAPLLDNRSGAIDAAHLAATADAIDNRGGALHAADDVAIVATALDNTAGSVAAAGNLTVTAASLANDNGRLVGDRDVTVRTSSQMPGGTIASVGNVTLTIDGDYRNAGLLSAQQDLTVQAANIDNRGTLTAGQTLTADTGNLTNAGEISGQTVRINASGTLTNTATGLIDGADTRITAQTVDNTGRLYGDWLRIQAGTVNNSGPGVIAARDTLLIGAQILHNTGGALIYSLGDLGIAGSLDANGQLQGTMHSLTNASSRIEAAGNLAIASTSIVNRNDGLTTKQVSNAPVYREEAQPVNSATRYPVTQCEGIGGSQDDNGCIVHPDRYGQRSTVLPAYTQSCTYDPLDGSVCTAQPSYGWDAPVFAQFQVTPVGAPPSEPAGGCTEPSGGPVSSPACTQWSRDLSAWNSAFQAALAQLDAKIGAYNAEVNEDNRIDQFEDYTWYKVASVDTHTVVASTAPGQILSGAGMRLAGRTVNQDSQIVAGGALVIDGPAVSNLATQGEERTDYSGTSQYTQVDACGTFGGDHCRQWGAVNPYNPAPVSVLNALPTLRYEAFAGNQTAARNLTPAVSSADASLASAMLAADGNNRAAQGQTMESALPLTAPLVLSIPRSSLFQLHAEPVARYLVETDPRFTRYRTFLSSDYFLHSLDRDPARQLKRYGDGFLEQQLVNDQILALTGRRYLDGYASTEDEYRALMNAGVAFARRYQLTPGVALSADQMARLSTDIVWLTTRTVTLADGATQQVLVPQVFLRRPAAGDLQASGALIAGSEVLIQTEGDLVNSGALAGNTVTAVAGHDLVNQGGRIGGQDLYLRAGNDLKNLSGVITGRGDAAHLALLAGRDILLQTQTGQTASRDGSSTRTSVQRITSVQGGELRLDAGRDLAALGATVTAQGSLLAAAGRDLTVAAVANEYRLQVKDRSGRATQGRSAYIQEAATAHQLAAFNAGNNLDLIADNEVAIRGANLHAGAGDALIQGRNVTIDAVNDRTATDIQTVGLKSYSRVARDNETLVTGSVTAGNDLTIRASGSPGDGAGDITLTGGYVSAQNGQAVLIAASDITIRNATTGHTAIDDSYRQSGDLFSSVATTRSRTRSVTQAQGSSVSGSTILARAGGDLTVQGSELAGDGDVVLDAAGKLTIAAATSTSTEKSVTQVRESGFLDGGGFGISYGQRITATDTDQQGSTQSGQSRSLVGSNNGILTASAGRTLTISGSGIAAGQDIQLTGKSVTIDTGRDTTQGTFVSRMEQDAFSLAIGGTVVNAIQTMETLGNAAGKTRNARVQALAAATAALAAANAAQEIAANGANVSLSLTYGHSESEQTQTHSSSTATGSTLAAGNNLAIRATGAGQDSNIRVVGSDLWARNDASLTADNQISLQAAQDVEAQHSKNKSMSAAAGVAVAVGTSGMAFGVNASASMGRTQEDGDGTTQRTTHVKAGNALTLHSGGDTGIRGAVVAGKQVMADVGGSLAIESLQDTARFDSKRQHASIDATAGFGASVSASFSQSSIHNDYASVQEQSGILAGDGGFQVSVKGNTDLKGAVIASSEQAVRDNRNSLTTATLTHSDIRSHADYAASSVGVSASASLAGGDGTNPADTGQGKGPGGTSLIHAARMNGAGTGLPTAMAASGSEGSTTRSGISGAAIVITDEAKQRAGTGKSADETVASLNRAVATGKDTSGRITDTFNRDEIEAGMTVAAAFVQQAAPVTAYVVGNIGSERQQAARNEANRYQDLADRAGTEDEARQYRAKANEATAAAEAWGDNGIHRLALHAAAQAFLGGLAGGGEGAFNSGAGVVGGNLGQQLGQQLGEQEAARQGLSDEAKGALVNSYQQVFAAIGGALAGAASGNSSTGGALVGAIQGGSTAYVVDAFNRQLHPDEIKWLKDNAKRYAAQRGISEVNAERQLAQQAYRQVQDGAAGAWDQSASEFLKQAHGMLSADGVNGIGYLFQATAEQKADSGMYVNLLPQTANFYARNGITIPTAQQAAAGTQRGNEIRDTAAALTKLAVAASGATALAGLPPALLTWALSNPAQATTLGVITAETAAAIKSGAITPALMVEVAAVKTGQAAAKELPLLRQQYVNAVDGLIEKAASMRAEGASAEEIARVLHAERNTLKLQYRDLSPAELVKQFEQRNIQKYGNSLGPSIDQLHSQGKTWEQIIESASRSGGKDLGF